MSAQMIGVYEPSPPSLDMHEAVSAWFLGPQAENFEILSRLFNTVLDEQAKTRRSFHPEDGIFITDAIKSSATFKLNTKKLYDELDRLSLLLNKYSVPFYSPRYAGHMSFETSMPAIVGYLATILFNPNNVAFEASPFTTQLEIDVGTQLCDMLGYSTSLKDDSDKPIGWGHIACDGSVANLESIWAARNLKFYPLSLRDAMGPGEGLEFIASSFKAPTCLQKTKLFIDFSTWELLNMRVKDVLDIPTRLQKEYEISTTYLEEAMRSHVVQTIGKDVLERRWQIKNPPQYLISSTKHYSWPKGAAITGIGSENMVDVPIDINARVNVEHLERYLDDRHKKEQAVYAVVAIIGSTEEGAVDDLERIVAIRDRFLDKGMSFVVHADAAWGGYFASMIRDKPKTPAQFPREGEDEEKSREFVPSVTLRNSTVKQFDALKDADSITIDPHKSGYVPYPAGGLCYRDGRMRFLLTWTAPYVNQGVGIGESIGVFGVEGSKPGASVAAVYLHHSVVGLHKEGHGGLLGEVSFTCRRISAHWAAMSTDETEFVVVPLNKLQHENDPVKLEKEKELIRTRILGQSNEKVFADKDAMKELCTLGSDLNINAFACNFKIDGKVNEDVEEANYLNKCVYDKLSVTTPDEDVSKMKLFITSTVFANNDYGECADHFKERIGLETASKQDLFVLRNVCMSPFQTAGDFVSKLAKIFEGTLEGETAKVIRRNTITKQDHVFTMQGVDNVYLVYRPMFHWASSRYQLVLQVDFADANGRDNYAFAMTRFPDVIFTFTVQDVVLADLMHEGLFEGIIEGGPVEFSGIPLRVVKVVKQSRLDSKFRDLVYPATFTPFYLYGTPEETHIDHMLLIAPNAQLSAECVELRLDKSLTAAQLEMGLILAIERPERSMQPFGQSNVPTFFKSWNEFTVRVFRDPHDAVANGPGLFNFDFSRELVAKGRMVLGQRAFVNAEQLNQEAFGPDYRAIGALTSNKIGQDVRAQWADAIHSVRASALPGVQAKG